MMNAKVIRGVLAALVVLSPVCRGDRDEPGNRAPNAGFEEPAAGEGRPPAQWLPFTSHKRIGASITAQEARTGKQCVRMTAQGERGAAQALMTDVPVEKGGRYTFEACFKKDEADRLRGSAECVLIIEWLDVEGREVGRSSSGPLGASLSRMKWKPAALKQERAPAGAVTGRFGIHFLDGEAGGKGSVLVDDVTIAGGS